MKQVSSSNDWFFVHEELGPDGKPAVSPILAFAVNNHSDVVPLIADGGITKEAPHQKGTIKFLGQLLEKEAIAAGVIGRWLMLRSSPRK